MSDLRGSFDLNAGEKGTIVFSRVGYQTRMLPAEARFDQKNGDFIYKLEGHEVIPLLLEFFADEAKNH